MRGATTTSTPRLHPPRVLSGAEGAANARDREAMLISGGDSSSVTSRVYRVRMLPSPRESSTGACKSVVNVAPLCAQAQLSTLDFSLHCTPPIPSTLRRPPPAPSELPVTARLNAALTPKTSGKPGGLSSPYTTPLGAAPGMKRDGS